MIDSFSCSIGSYAGKKVISRIIVFFQRLINSADKSHTFFLENRHNIIETHAFQGVRMKPLSIYHGKETTIYRPTFIPYVTAKNMVALARYATGDGYGWDKIPLHALDCIFNTYRFTQRFSLTHFKVCSQLIGWLFQKTPTEDTNPILLYKIATRRYNHPQELNYKFGCDWKSLTPDGIEDWLKDNPHEWVLTKGDASVNNKGGDINCC